VTRRVSQILACNSQPGTRLLLIGILPTTQPAADKNLLRAEINHVTRKLIDIIKCDTLSFTAIFRSSKGSVSNELMPDGTHLSSAGYAILTPAVLQ